MTIDTAAELRRENEELCEENRQLREAFYGELPFLGDLGLTRVESRIVAALYRAHGEVVTTAALHIACANSIYVETCEKLVSVYIVKIRRKLAQYGIQITTVRGVGFRLPDHARLVICDEIASKPRQQLAATRRHGASANMTTRSAINAVR